LAQNKTLKHKLRLIVSYESAGGMGEHDAIEEGLRNLIETKENPNWEESDAHCSTCQCWRNGTPFKVEKMEVIK
jgi:hypothetical protein